MSVQNYTKEAIENRMYREICVSIQASLESRTTQWWKVAQLGSGKLSNFAPKVEQLSETSRATFRDELPDYRKQVGQLQCRELPDLRSSKDVAHTNLPLQEVAEICGFVSQAYPAEFCLMNSGASPVMIQKNG